ncbi:MAG: 30S ribosomal protein S4 [Ruminococcaceae bacterium]|nr:30S ribosomal protein S4 [Oscillospiraceae bacterium]
MAKNTQPIAKRCKTLGVSPAAMGYAKKETNRNPGGQMRRKKSEYALQLNEKQKVKFVYGILEKQFRSYFEKAIAMQGKTGENLLILVERRLDNIVYRAGFAMTRREARQLVSHAHFTVNGKKVNIPSYLVKPGDVIAISEKSMSLTKFKSVLEANALLPVVSWMDVDKTKGQATITAMPVRDEIDFEIQENLIVELYSK